MEQRPFGTTGMNVSALGFGCGNVGGLMVRGSFEEQTAAVQRAFGAGITYFDTAAQYGNGRSEENLGRVLTHLNVWDRVHVGTKLRLVAEEFSDPAPAIRRRMTENLRRLGRESVDLIQLHNNLTLTDDNDRIGAEHHETVAAAMRDLVREGLARHIGFTGMGDTGKVAEAISGGSFESIQAYFNALNPSYGFASANGGSQDFGGLIDRAAAQGLAVIAIRVLAGGALAGTSERAALASPTPGDLVPGSVFEEDVKRATRLKVLASELGCESAPEMSLRLVLANPGVSTALIGFSDQTQLEDAIRWAEHGPLSDDAVRRVVEIAQAQSAG